MTILTSAWTSWPLLIGSCWNQWDCSVREHSARRLTLRYVYWFHIAHDKPVWNRYSLRAACHEHLAFVVNLSSLHVCRWWFLSTMLPSATQPLSCWQTVATSCLITMTRLMTQVSHVTANWDYVTGDSHVIILRSHDSHVILQGSCDSLVIYYVILQGSCDCHVT